MNAKSTILSIIKVLTMPVIVFALILYLKNFGDILTGVYILFPICFIVQGIFLSKTITHLITTYTLAIAIFLISMNMWYHVADSWGCAISYLILGIVAFAIKLFVVKKKS